MKMRVELDVHHLTRVEGHGNIVVRVRDGKLQEARWDVVETPRYFEAILKGKHYTMAAPLTSRICGICSLGHQLASLRATENAFGITVPPAAEKLRLLAKHAETLQSHALHVFFLAAPDFFAVPSVLPLVETHPDLVQTAVRIKGAANYLAKEVAGRAVHPVSLHVGGVQAIPKDLRALRDAMSHALEDLRSVVPVFQQIELPDFKRETEFVSLEANGSYPWIGGNVVSTDGVKKKEEQYLEVTNEYLDKHNTSKWAKLSRESYAVGALARFNNSSHRLEPEAQELAKLLGLQPVSHNPYHNNIAQLVECVHVVIESIRLIDELEEMRGEPTMCEVKPVKGQGVGAVEVPRGILFHHYTYDAEGRIKKANCIIPTTQNNANIHHDMSDLVEWSVERGKNSQEIELLCSMLVRAYDPCISCSVH